MNYIIEYHKFYYAFIIQDALLYYTKLLEISGYNNSKGNIYS